MHLGSFQKKKSLLESYLEFTVIFLQEEEEMIRGKSVQIYLYSVLCILLNYVGRLMADCLQLPLWMDSIGTAVMAYVYGPVCGSIVGVSMNVLCAFSKQVNLYYALTSVAVGTTIGICAKKGFFKDVFGTLTVAFLVTILSVTISTPLNFLFSNGAIDNIWGDSMAAFLQELGCKRMFSIFLGQLYLEFLDKVITMLLLFWGLKLVHHRRKIQKKGKAFLAMLLLVCMSVTFIPEDIGAKTRLTNSEELTQTDSNETEQTANADSWQYDFQRYIQTVYNGENGIPGGAANDIAQTKDGILWIGTYGGLYRYNGSQFQWMNEFESVKTVNCMYTDEAGRLWIGTNDDGLSICINEEISNVVNREGGLPSNSVRCITESTDGMYYVGTTGSLVVMTLNGGLKVKSKIPEVIYAESISAGPEGLIAAVTNEGDFYLIKGTEILEHQKVEQEGEAYNCCAFDESGKLYLGTSSNRVEVYDLDEDKINQVSVIACGILAGINSINQTEDGTIFICADNGMGYFDGNAEYCSLDSGSFNSSIDHMLMDYQGNLWFTSSRLGVMRSCPSAFSELFTEALLPEQVVNTITRWRNYLYFGTDSGLYTVDSDGTKQVSTPLGNALEGVRIRCLLVDSSKHLWICTSERGIWEVTGYDQWNIYDSTNGAIGEKFRSIIETRDGTMVAAGDSGITFIKNQSVIGTIGYNNGLSNPKVLSLYEMEDGRILAGTDGNGIAVIKDKRITGSLKQSEGLSSEIILRMVGDSDGQGLFIVTGNGICYMEPSGEIRLLDKFPYFNNYDLVDSGNGKLFSPGSAGIHVVDKKELLEGKEVSYELLDSSRGLRMGLTPNSWNYMDDADNLYLSGDRGVVRVNVNQYDVTERSYRMLLKSIDVDGETFLLEKGRPVHISRGAKKIKMNPEIVNFSVNNPSIRVWLEGFDKEPYVMTQSEMTPLVYTNLPAGTYTFHVAVLDRKNNSVFAENTYQIIKDQEFYDHWWFKFYLIVVTAMMISYLTWLFFRTQIQRTLQMQRMELEVTKKQLQMGNETILTIAQAVDAKDENTSQHSIRVSEYAVKIAERLGCTKEQCDDLKNMAMLHDIGKIGIPDRVLNKPGKLTDEEYAIMKSHVEIGAEILRNFTWIDYVADGALYHHERYDGRGYVHGLKGEEIPLNARIIGIVDAFDAMTANRVYRKKLDFAFVLEELRKGRGTQFDPKLVDIFLELIEDGTVDVKQIYDTASGRKEQSNEEE